MIRYKYIFERMYTYTSIYTHCIHTCIIPDWSSNISIIYALSSHIYIYNVYLRTLHIKLYIYLVIVFPCVAPPELLVFQVLAQLAKGTDKDCDPVAGSETQCVQPGDDVTVLGSHGLTVIDWWVIYSSSLKHRRVKSTEKMVN